MMRSEYPASGATRRRLGWGGAGAAALTLLVLGSVWSACTIDDRNPGVGAGGSSSVVNPLLGGSGGDDGSQAPVGVASIAVDPSSLDLGPVVIGSPVRARLHVDNTGDIALSAPSVTLASGGPAFSVIQNSCEAALLPGQTLLSGQSCDVRVQLLADRAGSIGGQLAIDAAGSTWNVPLAAVGSDRGALILAPAAGSSDDFGSVRLGTAAQAVFNLTNPGASASGPVSVHLYNGDVTVLSGAPGSCISGMTSLAPGDTCDLHLAFGPSHRGPSDALLVVTTDAAGSVGLPLSGRGVMPGTLGVSQTSLDFDGVVLGTAGDRVLRVSNQGDEPLTLLGATLAQLGEFSISSSDCSSGRALAAGASCDVITEFRPTSSGDGKSVALTVAMNGGASQVVTLLGAGLDQGSLVVTPLQGNAVDFGAVALGDASTQAFRVTNASAQTSGPLAISASGDFTLVEPSQPDDCVNTQTSLENGAGCNLTVKLAPKRRAAQYGSLSIRSPLAKSAGLSLSGTGMAPAQLTIAQDEINFGRVLTGGTYQASLTVVNQGDQPLPPPVPKLLDASGAPSTDFSVDGGCTAAIGFQASCVFNVHFQPSAPGFPLALLRLESDPGGAASTLLFGEVSQGGKLVLAVADGESADFGDVGVQSPKVVNFTLTNPTPDASGRLSITVSSPLFSIDSGTCNPAGSPGLANGQSCTFSVTYTPQAADAVNATLSIQSPGAGGAALSLTGQGRSPANLVAVGNRDFGTANVNQPAATDPRNDFTWTLTNDGDLATGSLTVSNSNAADFTVGPDACSGKSLIGHTSCDLSIRFRPAGTPSARSGDLAVLDATNNQTVTLKMTGNGVQIAQPGQSCVTATCATGSTCTGSVCCDRACAGGCQKCDSTGVCHDQSSREACGINGTGVCFGVDQCLFPEGKTCTGDNQCGSGNCEQKLGGSSLDKVCCLEKCASGDQCSPDGQGCQVPTLAAGAPCGGATDLPCGAGLQCKGCQDGSSQCTPSALCCGGCPGAQTCIGGSCGCATGTVDCQDGRCIANGAGACCDNNGCTTQGGHTSCSSQTNRCTCPASAPRDCGNNVCVANTQCCGSGGPCQTCNTATGTFTQVQNGQQGQCGAGQVCQNGSCAVNNVGLGQTCNVSVNNCAAPGTCVNSTCICAGNTPNQCGTRCVNFQTDGANCGACNTSCGALGCTQGRCNCPQGQTFAAGSCKKNDGQTCTQAAECVSGCTMWFMDNDGDGVGSGAGQGRCGPNSPPSFQFVTRSGDCCDIAGNAASANAFPGQSLRFGDPLPAACVNARTPDHDYNCNGRNEGAPTVNCSLRPQSSCAIGDSTSGQNPGDIVPTPQVDTGDVPDGTLFCGGSVGPGTCAFFTDANPSPFGLTGCAPNNVGFTQLPCN